MEDWSKIEAERAKVGNESVPLLAARNRLIYEHTDARRRGLPVIPPDLSAKLDAVALRGRAVAAMKPATWQLPLAVPAVAFGLPGLVIAARLVWRRLHPPFMTSDGRCGRCGYDMQATPVRCPECGSPGWAKISAGT
jgi:hypothetical protein